MQNTLRTRRWLRRAGALISGLSGALIALVAFLIPSIQDQWDRYESRQVIERYAELGNRLMKEKHYNMAESAFQKAFELSENKRLDIEERRLQAHIQRIYQDPYWRHKGPEDLKEIDFQYLLGLQSGPKHRKDQAVTLGAYGCWLVSMGRPEEAKARFEEAIRLNPDSGENYLNFAILLDDLGDISGAEKAYQEGLALSPKDAVGHYNYALLLEKQRRTAESLAQLQMAATLAPKDPDIRNQLEQMHKKK